MSWTGLRHHLVAARGIHFRSAERSAATEQPSRGRQRMILAAMTLANAMILVDQTAVPLTLPSIRDEFQVSPSSVQWVLTGSLLPLAGLLVFGGRVADLLGRRRIFLTGAVLFAGASVAAGLAPEFWILIGARILQGVGGALMLPASVAIVGDSFSAAERGRALGTMGGVAAVAGALGPMIGGVLTSAISWRAVLLVNVPLVVLTVLATLRSVPARAPLHERTSVDLLGSLLLCIAIVGLVFGVAQTQTSGWTSLTVLGPLSIALAAGVLFVVQERRAHSPLMSFTLLRRKRNYLGATVSQTVGGFAEMGLGVIFPLVLILNLQMDPALAGLALIPTTVPMIILAPLVGRWYDRAGGRVPLVVGFACLAAAGLVLALGVDEDTYLWLLPGLVLYGMGLAIVLTANDPVSLDTVPDSDHGQASGVSATAEQFGGAIGIAALYAVFHVTYFPHLTAEIDASGLPDLNAQSGEELKAGLLSAEATGLDPATFDSSVSQYLLLADSASDFGYAVVFLVVAALAVLGAVSSAWLVRRPDVARPEASEERTSRRGRAIGTATQNKPSAASSEAVPDEEQAAGPR